MYDHKIFTLHYLLAEQELRIYAKWCKKRGISFANMQLLECISSTKGGIEPSVLADRMMISRQTMTGLLDQLEKKKLISRKGDVKDRRKVQIFLEEEGQARLGEVFNELLPHEMAVMQSIDPEEFKIFNKVFAKIVDGLSNQLLVKE